MGALAFVAVARLISSVRRGADAWWSYLGAGLLVGAAFWQQPVALAYAGAVALALALRRATWRDGWALLLLAGAFVGGVALLLLDAQKHLPNGGLLLQSWEAGHLAGQA